MSAPLLYKLYLRSVAIFQGVFGGGAAYSEPLISTFSRELVDVNNNTVLTAAQAAALVATLGSGNNPSYATVALPTGVLQYQVTGLDLPFVPKGVICTVLTNGNNDLIGAYPDLNTLTTDGFLVRFDGTLPAGYLLSYYLLDY